MTATASISISESSRNNDCTPISVIGTRGTGFVAAGLSDALKQCGGHRLSPPDDIHGDLRKILDGRIGCTCQRIDHVEHRLFGLGGQSVRVVSGGIGPDLAGEVHNATRRSDRCMGVAGGRWQLVGIA